MKHYSLIDEEDSPQLVQIYWGHKNDPPFICGFHGNPASGIIESIERDWCDDTELHDSTFEHGCGDYLFEPVWQEEEYDESVDPPRLMYNGYWELRFIKHRPLARCVGNRGDNSCGFIGGESGETCPECGGMLLSEESLQQAEKLQQVLGHEKEMQIPK